MRVYFSNLGCKLNQAELESLARAFVAAGYGVAETLEEADLHVVNTCTVTAAAARDSRKTARRGKRANPAVRTILTGCWVSEPERAGADGARAAVLETGADLLVPNVDKDRLIELALAEFPVASSPKARDSRIPEVAQVPEIPGLPDVPYVPLRFGNSRALLKIEDGCNMRCSFCVIPATRGRQRSRPAGELVAELRALVAGGYREVVVTGVQISAYRWRGQGLFELVRRFLDETDVERLRLTSIAPWQFDRRLFALFASGRVCRHVHLSLQSGAASTLERMRRPYDPTAFANLVGEIRAAVPRAAITTDVIVGFPGESGAEFQRSAEFVRSMAFARVHAFPFSPRSGTEAATLPYSVDSTTKKERMKVLLAIARRSEKDFIDSQLGQPVGVLWETEQGGVWRGTSDNYLRVGLPDSADLARRLETVVPVARTGISARALRPAGTVGPIDRGLRPTAGAAA